MKMKKGTLMVVVDQRIVDESELILENDFISLRLIRDRDLPWFVLVPKIEGATELIDLDEREQGLLLIEINKVSRCLREQFKVDKINIGIIGNMVRQLHIHIVGRFESDRHFPRTIWGNRLDISAIDPLFVERMRQCSILSQ